MKRMRTFPALVTHNEWITIDRQIPFATGFGTGDRPRSVAIVIGRQVAPRMNNARFGLMREDQELKAINKSFLMLEHGDSFKHFPYRLSFDKRDVGRVFIQDREINIKRARVCKERIEKSSSASINSGWVEKDTRR